MFEMKQSYYHICLFSPGVKISKRYNNHDQNIQSKLIRTAGNINYVTIDVDCCGNKGIL